MYRWAKIGNIMTSFNFLSKVNCQAKMKMLKRVFYMKNASKLKSTVNHVYNIKITLTIKFSFKK